MLTEAQKRTMAKYKASKPHIDLMLDDAELKQALKERTAEKGKSVNQYIVDLIKDDIGIPHF